MGKHIKLPDGIGMAAFPLPQTTHSARSVRITSFSTTSRMAVVQGICDPRFESVRALFEKKVAAGEELGASITVNIDGKDVVDIHGGYTDEARATPWDENTIVNVWSSTKTVTALAVLMLHDRGLIDVNENVSKYWPEFGANGKENIKVRHLLSHTSGVSAWDQPITLEDIYDIKRSTERLAEQAPWWEPGTASGYHACNMGHLLGELVRRTTGKSLTQFVAEEIAGPLGADFQIGAKESDWPRISNLTPPPPVDLASLNADPSSVRLQTFTGPAIAPMACNSIPWRQAEIGAANGHGNSRALGRILSAITLGGAVDGHQLLSPQTIDLIFQQQSDGTDLVLGLPIRFGIGFAIAGGGSAQSLPFIPGAKDRRVCTWGGFGGSWEIMDLDKRMTITYVMNKMGAGILGSERTAAYMNAVYHAIE